MVAAYDCPAAMLGPDLAAATQRPAPRVRLAFVLPDATSPARMLERGEADLFVGLARPREDRLVGRTLLKDQFAAAQRHGHPRGSAPLTLDAFCAADHLLTSTDGAGFQGRVDAALARVGKLLPGPFV